MCPVTRVLQDVALGWPACRTRQPGVSMGAKCTVMNDEPSEYETTEYEYKGKKVRIVYV